MWIILAKLVFWGHTYTCACRTQAVCPALDGWGGVQDHRVVVGGRRAARDLPFQLGVVVGEPAPAFADVPTAGMAGGPGEVTKPRLLTLTGHSQVGRH